MGLFILIILDEYQIGQTCTMDVPFLGYLHNRRHIKGNGAKKNPPNGGLVWQIVPQQHEADGQTDQTHRGNDYVAEISCEDTAKRRADCYA
jgi:hypothetical protein